VHAGQVTASFLLSIPFLSAQVFVALMIAVELLLGRGGQQQIVPLKTWQNYR
jgi:hypothetical protein